METLKVFQKYNGVSQKTAHQIKMIIPKILFIDEKI